MTNWCSVKNLWSSSLASERQRKYQGLLGTFHRLTLHLPQITCLSILEDVWTAMCAISRPNRNTKQNGHALQFIVVNQMEHHCIFVWVVIEIVLKGGTRSSLTVNVLHLSLFNLWKEMKSLQLFFSNFILGWSFFLYNLIWKQYYDNIDLKKIARQVCSSVNNSIWYEILSISRNKQRFRKWPLFCQLSSKSLLTHIKIKLSWSSINIINRFLCFDI